MSCKDVDLINEKYFHHVMGGLTLASLMAMGSFYKDLFDKKQNAKLHDKTSNRLVLIPKSDLETEEGAFNVIRTKLWRHAETLEGEELEKYNSILQYILKKYPDSIKIKNAIEMLVAKENAAQRKRESLDK